MNPDAANLLAQLRDIHAAPQVPWWPPAPGWWLLGALLGIMLFWLFWRLLAAWVVRRRRRRSVRQFTALRSTLDPGSRPQEYLAAVNRVLKRVAIRAFPGEPCANLEGVRWTRFLQDRLGANSVAGLEALAAGPYQPRPTCDAEALDALVRRWIRMYG